MQKHHFFFSVILAISLGLTGCVTGGDSAQAVNKKAVSHQRAGFHTELVDGRLWVLREGSEELADFVQNGPPDKNVTRIVAGDKPITLRAVDTETIDAYLHTRPGFATYVIDGRMWVLREGSEDLKDFRKNGAPDKSVTRIGVNGFSMPIRSVDDKTLDDFLSR